jgi:hypothetical protein
MSLSKDLLEAETGTVLPSRGQRNEVTRPFKLGGVKRPFKLGGRAARLGSVFAVVIGLSMGVAGSAGAAGDANFAFARTQGYFSLTWGFPGIPFHFSFGKTAANVSFRVNGQAYGQGGFSVPALPGPSLADPSAANASGNYCQGCLTNAIAINVDVISGPANSVFAPTNAVATDNNCLGCNTLAADYTFVVAPGTTAALTPSGLSDLYTLASTVVSDANTVEPSPVLAVQVVSALNAIQALLENPAELDPVGSPQPAAVAQLAPHAGVQELGETQYATG